MAGVYKRPTDRQRGKRGKWTLWYVGEDGRRQTRVAFTDKTKSLELAHQLEAEARRVREGLVEPGQTARREAAARPLADHLRDYRDVLIARGDTAKHAQHTASTIGRLLVDAGIKSVAEIAPERLVVALGRWQRSARTRNHALSAVKSFARWLDETGRIARVPRGLLSLKPYNELMDRRRVRRALTVAEISRLLETTERGEPIVLSKPRARQRVVITGLQRATLYRVAMGTGFRANELRMLTRESFRLDGDSPVIVVLAAVSKRRRDDVQPIRRDLAEQLAPYVASIPPGQLALVVPTKTAQLLRHDLQMADIPICDAQGRVVDFHALRHSYITHLVQSGANPKIVQTLARHSSIALTLDRYVRSDDLDLRRALEADDVVPQK